MPSRSEDAEIQPVDLYRHIESWWGEDFNDALIERMLHAPEEHQMAFLFTLGSISKGYALHPSFLEELPTGVMRPALPPRGLRGNVVSRRTAVRLLLYAHEVVLDTIEFHVAFDPRLTDSFARRYHLQFWARVRPLVEDGSIKLTPILGYRPSPDSEVSKRVGASEPIPGIHDLDEKYGFELVKYVILSEFGGLTGICDLAAAHQVHMLALSDIDQQMIELLLNQPSRSVDNRQVALHKLAALRVPTMMGGVNTLVALRKSDADFAEWRTRLGLAMSYVSELGEDEKSLKEAAEVVYAELSDGLSHVEKAVNKSPALQSLKGGVTGFALSGVSAGVGAMATGGQPWGALVGGLAGKGVETAVNYVKAVKERRKGRLFLDVAMMFDSSRRS